MYLYFTSFPVAGSNPGKLTVVMSSSPLVCESVSQSFIFHKLIHSFEEWSGILQSVPQCGFVWCCFSWSGWVDWDCGVLHTQRCPSHNIILRNTLPYDLLLVMFTMITWLMQCLSAFLTIKLLFSPFHMLFFGTESLSTAHNQRQGCQRSTFKRQFCLH